MPDGPGARRRPIRLGQRERAALRADLAEQDRAAAAAGLDPVNAFPYAAAAAAEAEVAEAPITGPDVLGVDLRSASAATSQRSSA